MKSKILKLIYWADSPNFGDYLSPYVIGKLSGMEIRHKIASLSWINLLKTIIGHPDEIKDLPNYVLPWEHNYLGIGSVLSYGNSRSEIWGSGFMNREDHFHGGKVYALRGELSEKKIGREKCGVYGDPALLLPILFSPRTENKYEIGIVPHWRETSFFQEKYRNKYHIIDLRTSDVEKVVSDICSCKFILSTSLHGIIVSHAYGIPAIWIKESEIDTDGFKYWDYFSSVNIRFYSGYEQYDTILQSSNHIKEFFSSNTDISLPQISINSIQKNLIESAPFDIMEIWKEKESQL
jgi:hypothetical protein